MAKKQFSKFLVLPITYLLLDLGEDFFIYKAELIQDPWLETAVVMGILTLGIAVVAFALVPFFEGGLETLRKSHKRHGAMGEFIFTTLLLAGIFFLYYVKTQNGLEALLPPVLLN